MKVWIIVFDNPLTGHRYQETPFYEKEENALRNANNRNKELVECVSEGVYTVEPREVE